MLQSLLPRDNKSGINALAIAQHSDPMKNHAQLLGSELRREELERRYEVVCLVLAFSVCVNLGGIIYFLIKVI
jgi:hypothetical protein